MDNQASVGPPSEKTEYNIRRARSHSWYAWGYLIEWQYRTQGCTLPHGARVVRYHLFPHWDGRMTEFWNQGPVWWGRFYWFTFGLSVVKPLPERRVELISNGWPNRRITYGTSEAYSRRNSED